MKIFNIILILFTSTGTAAAAQNGPQLSANASAFLYRVLKTDIKTGTVNVHDSTLYNYEDLVVPSCSQTLADTFATNPVLSIKELRTIVLDYYKNHDDLEALRHLRIKPENNIRPLDTKFIFLPNAARLFVTVTRHFDNCPAYYPELTIIESTNPSALKIVDQTSLTHSPAKLYAAAAVQYKDGNKNKDGVVLYRNRSKLLVNALAHTKPTKTSIAPIDVDFPFLCAIQ